MIPLNFRNKRGREPILLPQAFDGENPDAHGTMQEVAVTALAQMKDMTRGLGASV